MAGGRSTAEGTGDDGLFVVVNGACKDNDFTVIGDELGRPGDHRAPGRPRPDRPAGPRGRRRLASTTCPDAADMVFMDVRLMTGFGVDLIVSRSGYTGEDGYEISVPGGRRRRRLEHPAGRPAREAHRPGRPRLACAWRPACRSTATTSTRPSRRSRRDLTFAINKNRREQRDFPGAARIVARTGRRPGPRARRPAGAGRRAGPRRRRDRRRGRRRRSAWSPPAASRPS